MNTKVNIQESLKIWKLNLGVALLLSVASILTGSAPAQEPAPFVCDGDAFIVQEVSAVLNKVNLNGSATLTPILAPAVIEYNNMGFRSTDGLLYAVRIENTGYQTGNPRIVRIDSTGAVTVLDDVSPLLPQNAATRFDAGDISADGSTMYITFGARNGDTSALHKNELYMVDLTTSPPTLIGGTFVTITGDDAWVNDWAYGPGGLLYGGDQWGTSSTSNSQLSVLDPTTGIRTDYNVPGLGNTGAFGAAWYDAVRGTIFIYENAGNIYEIDVSDLDGVGPSILNSWEAPASSRNDGTFCFVDVELSLDIEKSTNGFDADDPTGPEIIVGESVEWEYVVTNNSTVTLTDIEVTDDILGSIGTIASLDPGASTSLTANGIAVVGQYANIGTASATYDGQEVSDTDPSHYLGVEAVVLDLDIEKSTNGFDADDPTGPEIIVGESVEWEYVVTNNSTVTLTDIEVTDDILGSIGTIASLDPGASTSLTANGIAVVGQYANIGTASATYDGQEVSDTDPSHYLGLYWAFTPGFWKNNTRDKGKTSHDAWKYTAYQTDDALADVFDSDCLDDYTLKRKTFGEYTLIQALEFQGGNDLEGALEILLRAAVASLLNASFHEEMGNPEGVYPYTVQEIIALVNEAICSGDRDTMLTLYEWLDWINNGVHYIDWEW